MAFSADLSIDIHTDEITRLRQRVDGFIENTPAIEEEFSEEFAEDLVQTVKESVRKNFSRRGSTGQLEDNVGKRRRSSNRYTVHANAYNDGVNYAAWHEYAESSHYAYYEDASGENTDLINWAKRMGIYSDTWRVEVTPHSFMKPAVQNAIRKARRRMNTGDNAAASGLQKAFR